MTSLLSKHQSCTLMAALGLVGVTALSVGPLVLERRPVGLVPEYGTPLGQVVSKIVVLALFVAVIIARACVDRASDQHAIRTATLLACIAAGLTAWHWLSVDMFEFPPGPEERGPNRIAHRIEFWQLELYLSLFNGLKQHGTNSFVPHVYRPLPYGFARSIERATGDWRFSCAMYRWFFTYWFLWGGWWFSRRFAGVKGAWVTIGVIALLYPFSIWYYWGQLTDPLSHALFVLSLIYVVEDQPFFLAATLALGVAAKETAVVILVGYFFCNIRQPAKALVNTLGLAVVCIAAYFAARLPMGWEAKLRSVNGLNALMINNNLGIGTITIWGQAPLYQNYLFPIVYMGAFVPLIVRHWRRTDFRLKALCMTIPPLVLLSNLLFSWLCEARNYMPVLPILTAAAQGPRSWDRKEAS